MNDAVAEFEQHRRHLTGLAYRMLGSHAEAEDAVQEAWLRWSEADRSAVEQPRAFLSRTVTRLCLDRLKSAQVQREVYVGPWLPDPLIEAAGATANEPEMASELASDLSYAFMLALERLTPSERAAFLLHDVFEMDFSEVAGTLGRSEASCRQLATRARQHIREERPRFTPTTEQHTRLMQMFLMTAQTGNVEQLGKMLAQDAVFLSDGGGVATAARIPVVGRERVAKAFSGFTVKHGPPADARVRAARINGMAGVYVSAADGTPIQTLAVEFGDDSLIKALYVVRNPHKLAHLN